MTKQPHYATTLRLSRICRWFAAIVLVKVCLLLALVLGFPLPELSMDFKGSANAPKATEAQQTLNAQATAQTSVQHAAPVADPIAAQTADPQGSAAARAAAQMHPAGVRAQVQMPVPQGAANPTPWNAHLQQPVDTQGTAHTTVANAPATATPAASAPVVAAPVAAAPANNDSAWWGNILQLTRLPVPRLGVDQAAHAASLDAPPPPDFAPRGATQSPFTPPAQMIPQGQNADGTPIAPRTTTARPVPAGQAGPQTGIPADRSVQELNPRNAPPAPSVAPLTSPEDPTRQQQELARREQEVLVLKQQMEQRLQELQQTERKVQDMLKEARALEEKKISSLASMYINMKPKQAAKALESLDERIAVKILASMSPKQSGDILTYTDPKKTAKLTELISRMRIEQ